MVTKPILFVFLAILFVFISACQSQETALNTLSDNAVLYLGWDDEDIIQLFSVTENEAPIQLSAVAKSIQSYAVSPNKEVAFVTEGSLFWLSPTQPITNIFACTETDCEGLFWDSNGVLGFRYANNLLWIDPVSMETKPIFAGDVVDGKNGRLSPNEEWLSYVEPQNESLIVVNRITSETFIINGGTNTNASWHPNGLDLITSELITFQDAVTPHIVRLSTITQNAIDLTTANGFQFAADNWPSFSPDGSMIAFIRQVPKTNSGGQLWLMDENGLDQQPLLDDPAYAFGPPHWSADQTHLLTQQASIIDPLKRPAIILYNKHLTEIIKIAEEGFMPQWFVQ